MKIKPGVKSITFELTGDFDKISEAAARCIESIEVDLRSVCDDEKISVKINQEEKQLDLSDESNGESIDSVLSFLKGVLIKRTDLSPEEADNLMGYAKYIHENKKAAGEKGIILDFDSLKRR